MAMSGTLRLVSCMRAASMYSGHNLEGLLNPWEGQERESITCERVKKKKILFFLLGLVLFVFVFYLTFILSN